MRYDRLIAVSAFALTAAWAPLSAQAADIVQMLKDSGQYSQFIGAIDKAGLAETLHGGGPYTVFAPTDAAFQKLQQGSQGQQAGQGQQQAGQSQQQQSGQQQGGQSQQSTQGQSGGDGQILQQVSSDQLKQILEHHIVEGKELGAQDVLGKEQKVQTMSGDQLTVDGTGTMVVLVPAGLSVSRVGDEVFVRREIAAVAQPAVTVSTTGQQDQQQSAQVGSQGPEQRMAEQQGLLRAAMVVEPDIQADNGVIHGIDQVLVPQKLEQELMSDQAQSETRQQQKQG